MVPRVREAAARRQHPHLRLDLATHHREEVMTQCFYQPGTLSIIDLAVERDGALRGRYSNESLDEMRQRYPGAIVGDLDAFIEDKERQLRTEPESITAAQF